MQHNPSYQENSAILYLYPKRNAAVVYSFKPDYEYIKIWKCKNSWYTVQLLKLILYCQNYLKEKMQKNVEKEKGNKKGNLLNPFRQNDNEKPNSNDFK